MNKKTQLRSQILQLVAEYYSEAFPEKEFIPGETSIPVSGKVFDQTELQYLVDSSLDFWLTTGRFAAEFEEKFAKWLGVKHCLLVNSGSSANLLALTALTSPELGDRRLKPGDEIITVAAGFPTTVNPIFQNQLVPVFLDIEIPTYNIDITQLEAALSERTRGIMIAHALGNPFNLKAVIEFTKKYNLWLIEDNCDALGSIYQGQKTGTFGHIATASFYPAHHITMGEGGAVLTNDSKLKKIIESLRDWGRSCWCDPGVDNTCSRRFAWQLGDLPFGYDHKYTYSHIGYNLKMTDMQAAVGLAQLQKLHLFVKKRRNNFDFLYQKLANLQDVLILPKSTDESEPSWFGFLISVKENAGFNRYELVKYLEVNKISTRLLFGGNLIKQPAYKDAQYRVLGNLTNTNYVMENTFWIGVYPGIDHVKLNFIAGKIQEFFIHRI
ncbi:lipopolysaccharide biosynthesis protein RfbH [Calothrix membranacea FACHB-236]|nr:lipopolysaccharide biosynthesis protein RfbH [Calothrix membranacea FACHB-236]